MAQSSKPVATSAPATAQALTLEQERAKNRKSAEEEFAHLQTLAPRSIHDLFDFIIDHDQLVLIPRLGPTDNEPKRVEITDFPGLASIMIGTDKDAAKQVSSVKLQHYGFTGPGIRLKITQLLAPPTSLQIAQGIDAEAYSQDVSLMRQAEDPTDPNSKIVTTMYITRFGPDDGDITAKLSLKAASFVDLRRKYPRETQAYLVPILRDLRQVKVLAVDPMVAQQVLGAKSKPKDATVTKVNAVLAKFDSDKFQERESAAKDLQALGGEAALYLRNANRGGWSQEQINGVDAFLASFSTIDKEQASELAKSPAFLIDVLYGDDPGIRQSALDQLKKISSHEKPIDFDNNADDEKRYDQIDRLSREILGPPATQLATEKPQQIDTAHQP
ncbi:MAG TPA: hypothetical protein VL282_00835 [Tepidisphaeraceae bacterium]|jgi:hypothetical protein|nr:hypothetical protein [Tepidisphaeraceae bacterium]